MAYDPWEDDFLARLAKHVVYEVEQLLYSADRVAELSRSKPSRERNAHVESMLIHARNLIAFYQSRGDATDARARQFLTMRDESAEPAMRFTTVKWKRSPEEKAAARWLDSPIVREFIHKRVAHITFHRVDVPIGDEATSVPDLMRRLVLMWRGFTDALPPERRGWFAFTDPTLRLRYRVWLDEADRLLPEE